MPAALLNGDSAARRAQPPPAAESGPGSGGYRLADLVEKDVEKVMPFEFHLGLQPGQLTLTEFLITADRLAEFLARRTAPRDSRPPR